ncbi:MAG: hypothetical protein AB8G86_07190 [Saprospiraceae bacterium]
MKFIKKRKEPPTLKKYRETTPNAIYNKGFVDSNQLLKKFLLTEQGHICAYCMKRISLKRNSLNKPSIEVEHYLSQKKKPDLDLDFQNMLGVCNGYVLVAQKDVSISSAKKIAHCDKSKEELLLKKLNPLKNDIEKIISYDTDGAIVSVSNDIDVLQDLEILNLNDGNLIKFRRDTIDLAKELMIKKYPAKKWTKALIQKEIDLWKAKDKNDKFRPFCQIAIWFWEQQKKRNRYPVK